MQKRRSESLLSGNLGILSLIVIAGISLLGVALVLNNVNNQGAPAAPTTEVTLVLVQPTVVEPSVDESSTSESQNVAAPRNQAAPADAAAATSAPIDTPVPTAALVETAPVETATPEPTSAPTDTPPPPTPTLEPTHTPQANEAGQVTYKVKRGDTCSGIAKRFRVPLASLMKQNRLSGNCFLRQGQVLVIPASP